MAKQSRPGQDKAAVKTGDKVDQARAARVATKGRAAAIPNRPPGIQPFRTRLPYSDWDTTWWAVTRRASRVAARRRPALAVGAVPVDGAIDPVAAYACKHGCRRRRDRLRLQVAALAWRQVSAVVERKNELQSARRRRCHDDKVTFRKTNSSPLAGGDAVTTKSHFAKRTRGRNRRALPGVAAESHFAKRVREDRCRVLPGVAAESHFAKRVRGDRCRGLPGVAAESHFATADQRRTPSDLDATRARNAGEFV